MQFFKIYANIWWYALLINNKIILEYNNKKGIFVMENIRIELKEGYDKKMLKSIVGVMIDAY